MTPAAMEYRNLTPARTISEVEETLKPWPLQTALELQAFYSQKYSEARGPNRISQLGIQLKRAYEAAPFHGFVMGHPGVGKSTEISKLLLNQNQFNPLRISAAQELYPGEIRIQDLLWLMVIRILEATKSPVVSGFSDVLSPGLLEALRNELSEHWIETLGLRRADAEGGLDIKLLARIRATLKISRQSSERVQLFTFSALSDLTQIVNRVFNECNAVLRQEKRQEWIFVVEDFERLGVETDALRELFIHYSRLFEQFNCHLLFVIPVGLVYTEDAERMPFGRDRQFMIPDIAVFRRDHEVDEQGVGALLEVVSRRIEPTIIDDHLARSLAIASGGNIRDLFDLLRWSALATEVREGSKVEYADALQAVNTLRNDYRGRLGENLFDKAGSVSVADKIAKLGAIYEGDPRAQIPDKILYVLLRQRIVLQFNGQFWYGVHPLVVDILKDQKDISVKPDSPGGTDFRDR